MTDRPRLTLSTSGQCLRAQSPPRAGSRCVRRRTSAWTASLAAGRDTSVPGKQVRAKAGLNRSILDQGWFELRRQLQYKLSWQGGELILVPPRNMSRRCPQCDAVSAQNRPTQVRFACIACGFEANADWVGAINILRAGHARCACEVSDADRQQQEPTEAAREQLRAA